MIEGDDARGDFEITTQDGTSQFVKVPDVCHKFMQGVADAVETDAIEQLTTVPDGWIKSAGVYQMDPSALITKFTGQYTVPAPPTAPQKPESLYYFIGLEDRTQGKLTSIHQPVLTWGDQTEGGQFDNQWHLWSWTCCPKNLTWHSPDIAGFKSGDTIYAEIEKVSVATWRINGAFKDTSGTWQNTTLVSQVGAYNFNYADVTLEVYNITTCSQMSPGTLDFTNLALETGKGTPWVPPMWYITGQPSACDVKMKIVSPTEMTIEGGGSAP
jgi:hypothetical protein